MAVHYPETLLPAPSHITGPTWRQYEDGSWFLPEKTLGWQIISWLFEYVNSPAGDGPFVPTLEQARFIAWWYAVDDQGKYAYREGTLRRMKGWGKDPMIGALALAELCGPVAFSHFDDNGNPVGKTRHAAWITIAAVSQDQPLALNTEVPTPSGWTTVGNLSVGDYVLGSDGQPHRVQRETPVLEGLDTYVVRFDDGTEITASASHGWTTQRLTGHGDAYETVTVTTEELAQTVTNSKGRKRHRIPVVGMELPNQELPLDPWFLGLWLGDGATSDSTVSFDYRLRDEYAVLLKPLVQEFQTVVWDNPVPGSNVGTFRIKNNDRTQDDKSFRALLRKAGVLGNKHIPAAYMQAGTDQRFELLRGLIDSDGGIDSAGRAYFVNANRNLVYQFQELVVGLGFRCTVREHGGDGALRAEFNPGNAVRVSNLAYKFERQRPYSSRNRSQHRWVESVTPVESVPVKCIGIDTEDHLFQVSRSRILTHNTKNTFSLFPIMVSKKLKAEYGLSVNRFIIYSEIGGRLEAATASPASMEGNRPTFVVQNETQWWGVGPGGEVNDGHQMAEVIEGNMTKVDGARTLSICNAHRPGDDTVAEMSYLNWLDILAGDAIDTGVLYDALEAPADTPVSEIPFPSDDPEGYEAGVAQLMKGLEIARGDSIWLPLDDILMSVLTAKNDVIESRRKFLNQVNATEESWIAPSEWDRNHDINLPPLRKGERITLGFDGSLSNDHTALTACRVEDGALFLVKVWVPEKYEGHKVPRQDVDAYVRSMFEKYDVVGMRADVKEFEQSVDAWGQDFRRKLKINASPGNPVAFDMRGQQKRFALDCERFRDAVLAGEVKHDNNPVLKAHITNAHQHPTIYDAISIRKPGKESKRKIDAAVTAVLAWGSRQDFLLSKSNTGKGAGLLR
ncbi:terminase large subunit [Mycobacterium phage Fenn]|nr:terminase large subunit [Mycobacterium phage Fenn]QBI99281.1 terminase [Mycobacterium phage Naira]